VKKKKAAPAASLNKLELAPQLTIADAADLHREFKERAAGGMPFIIDGAKVEQIDTAILQLLVGAWRSCAQRGVECSWQGASQNLRRAALLIGVADHLNLNGA
jgi:anti-anti-sigma regulatory factor